VQDEESLVRRPQERGDEAWTGLYDKFFDRIYRYVRLGIGNRAGAEDVTEQAFFKAPLVFQVRG
jgi:DNA-directed RNA polymerase specialized sigma24 family protein